MSCYSAFLVYPSRMARPLRIELAGGLYHVTSRGDRRGAIYRGEVDREDWLDVLGNVCARLNWREQRRQIYFSSTA